MLYFKKQTKKRPNFVFIFKYYRSAFLDGCIYSLIKPIFSLKTDIDH